MVAMAHAECATCMHWCRNYDTSALAVKRGLPAMNSAVTGWCLLDVPEIAHPAIDGWNQASKTGAGIETRDTSVCTSWEEHRAD